MTVNRDVISISILTLTRAHTEYHAEAIDRNNHRHHRFDINPRYTNIYHPITQIRINKVLGHRNNNNRVGNGCFYCCMNDPVQYAV